MRPTRVAYLGVGLGLGFACVAALSATTYTVTTTADAGAGSLRQALTDASGAAGPHTIAFNIPGTGPHTIALASNLPNVNVDAGLTIDGTTQPGFAGTPQIEIHHDGTFSSQCLSFILTPVTIKALAINRCGTAINSTSGGSVTLLGSRLGTDPSGTVALGNAIGVSLSNGSAANVIGGPNAGDRNILSANTSNAIQFASTRGARCGATPSASTRRARSRWGTSSVSAAPAATPPSSSAAEARARGTSFPETPRRPSCSRPARTPWSRET